MADLSIEQYKAKRDFSKTSEPKGARTRKKGWSFVVQKHDATRLHYDFRLEHDGVLKSWAVTKGPSLDPGDKRLAVRTEDHPLDYGDFEGVIPKDQYGGGTVMLWDRGTWEPLEDPDEGFKEGKLKFILRGERLSGGWALVRMKGKPKEKRENWLLIKERDEKAFDDHGDILIEDATTSVKTGRSMEEIANGSDVWRSNNKSNGTKTSKQKKRRKKAGKVSLPSFIKPQLATLVEDAPDSDEWIHEIKYDGYRAIASVASGKSVIRTRNGHDWTDKFPKIAEALGGLDIDSALLDGEIAVADEQGHTDFGALQQAVSDGESNGLGYYVFDLLSLNGENLKSKPLEERKRRLEALLPANGKNGPLFYSDHIDGSGAAMFDRACDLELEGTISKKRDAKYKSGRSKSWLKIKCGKDQEFVVIGWRPSNKKRRPFSSILLAQWEGDDLSYRGRVGSGFGEAELNGVWPELKKRARKTAPADDIPGNVRRDAKYVTPDLVAQIAFRGWTREGYVRQGSFKGLRFDKLAKEVIKEKEMAAPSSASSGAEHGAIEIEGVRVTHPDRVLFPSQGATKKDLIDYYLAVADAMLPHVVNRPLSLVRCPQGRTSECFYQKHASPGFPDAFHTVEIRDKSGTGEYLYIRDKAGLVAAVQMGVLEIHIWDARRDKLEKPDRLVFDLDPDEGLDFARVKAAASDMRERLSDLGLESFLLATGGKGLHVAVPVDRRYGWDDHAAFAEAIARLMVEDSLDRYTATMSKAKRKGKIFVDYLRNQRGSTAISPFSSRAREGAPVAFPLSWNALGGLKSANGVSIAEAASKLKRMKSDPWDGYFEVRQALPLKALQGH